MESEKEPFGLEEMLHVMLGALAMAVPGLLCVALGVMIMMKVASGYYLGWEVGLILALAGVRIVLRLVLYLLKLHRPELKFRLLSRVEMVLSYGVKWMLLALGVWTVATAKGMTSLYTAGGVMILIAVLLMLNPLQRWIFPESRRRKASLAEETAAQAVEGIPYSVVAPHFRELCKYDKLALAEEDFVSWNSEMLATIQLSRMGEDDWICLFWGQNDRCLSDRILLRFCSEHGVELPEHFRRMKPDGIALYREGRLALYPEEERRGFHDAFRSSLLCSDAEFAEWLKEYTEQ